MTSFANSISIRLQNKLRDFNRKKYPNLRPLKSGEGVHIPNTNWCGPGTDIEDAAKYGITNPTDGVCRKHDYAYDNISKNLNKLSSKQVQDVTDDVDNAMLKELKTLPQTVENKLAYAGIRGKKMAEKLIQKIPGKKDYVYMPSPTKPPPIHSVNPIKYPKPKPTPIQIEVIDNDDTPQAKRPILDAQQDKIVLPGGGEYVVGGCADMSTCNCRNKSKTSKPVVRGGGIQLINTELSYDEGLDQLQEAVGSDKAIPQELLDEYVNDVNMLRTRIIQKLDKPKTIVKKRDKIILESQLKELASLQTQVEETELETMMYTPLSSFKRMKVQEMKTILESLGVNLAQHQQDLNKTKLTKKDYENIFEIQRDDMKDKDKTLRSETDIVSRYNSMKDTIKEAKEYIREHSKDLTSKYTNVNEEIRYYQKGMKVPTASTRNRDRERVEDLAEKLKQHKPGDRLHFKPLPNTPIVSKEVDKTPSKSTSTTWPPPVTKKGKTPKSGIR